METDNAALADIAKLIPANSSRFRKPLRCVITEAIRDELVSDVPTGLVENTRVASMLEADFIKASAALDLAMEEQEGAEQMLERRIFLQSNPPVTPEDTECLQKVHIKTFIKVFFFAQN